MHPWIESVTLKPATTPITVLPPDPATTVVWRMTPAGASDVLVAGPRTKATYHPTKDLPVCLRLRISPGGVIPLLDTAADELLDQVVPLKCLHGPSATDLAERLITHRNDLERAAEVLGDYLVAGMPARLPSRLDLVRTAVHELTGRPRVDVAAARLGVSERYLRRVFRQAVGVSPKHFARISRVRSVLGQSARWADAAAYAGYSDQSHLIADFRALMHVTPKAFAAGNVPLSYC
ncbi:helix-turn-helix domain-containing protein [Kribbella sp. NPDC004536]|uniref:helix-turn-helix domain-containing protein n=1 Tax=Kribbella sp. NPDC004536 TaxID=3364106 RepID=UPI0036844449